MKHMNPEIVIRNETDADVSAISEVTVSTKDSKRIAIKRLLA